MGVFEASVTLPRPRDEVFEFFRRPANLLKMFPNQSPHLTLKLPEIMNEGGQLEFDIRTMGNHFHVVHEVTEVAFHDRIKLQQVQGPFKAWMHEQHFADTSAGDTLLKTIIRFEPPGGMLGFLVTRKLVHSYLEKWITQGHELVRQELSVPTK